MLILFKISTSFLKNSHLNITGIRILIDQQVFKKKRLRKKKFLKQKINTFVKIIFGSFFYVLLFKVKRHKKELPLITDLHTHEKIASR